jgi:DNA-binding transcriptional LysR family regulator
METVMELSDLRDFLAIAQTGALRQAASAQHQSPSAMSKALRRLELQLQTTLFDRVGNSLRLNAQGERLRGHAVELVARADAAERDFKGASHVLKCRIAGPSVLLWRYGADFGQILEKQVPNSVLALETLFEDAAIAALLRGELEFALVSGLAISNSMDAQLQSLPLHAIQMVLAAAPTHALLRERGDKSKLKPSITLNHAKALEHAFACPRRSLFCGLERGARADGWRDDALPRKIHYWSDDFHVLLGLVQSGQALAYLPDFMLASHQLTRIQLKDCPYQCVEQAHLVWRTQHLSGWQHQLITQARRLAS